MMINRFRRLFISPSSSILLSNSTFKLTYSILLKFLPHKLLFSEPLVLLISINLTGLRIVSISAVANYNGRCLWHYLAGFCDCFHDVILASGDVGNGARNCHVPHHVVEFFVVIVLITIFVGRTVVCVVHTNLRIFKVNVNKLIFL